MNKFLDTKMKELSNHVTRWQMTQPFPGKPGYIFPQCTFYSQQGFIVAKYIYC